MSFADAFADIAVRHRTARNAAVVSAVLFTTAACTAQPPRLLVQPSGALVQMDPTSVLWLSSEESEAYSCWIGLLECHDVGGRLGDRRCRCVE